LVELLAVMALVALLTAVVTRGVARSRRRAYVAVLESDLLNLAVAQEEYFADQARYFGRRGGGRLKVTPDFEFTPSAGVAIEVRATATGWSARAVHKDLDPARYACAIYSGEIEPYPPADAEGYVICTSQATTDAKQKPKKKDRKKKRRKDKKKKGKKGRGGG
jgi:type II secretory pathway pseudopilin PulG